MFEPTLPTTQTSTERLSLSYLLTLTAAMGAAFAIHRWIDRLRFPADAVYYHITSIETNVFSVLVAAIYGLTLTTFVFAWKSGDIWNSPGKILALLFSTMCVLNWALEFTAAGVTHARMSTPIAIGAEDERGYLLGIWYRNFAASVGYVAGLPIVAWVVYKTRKQRITWRLVWFAFLAFSILCIADLHLGLSQLLPYRIRQWYFELILGLPVIMLSYALFETVLRRERVDWWTAFTATPVIAVWCIGMVIKLAAF